MYLFVTLNLILSVVVGNRQTQPNALSSDLLTFGDSMSVAGILIIAAALALGLAKRKFTMLRYDLFASGCLLLWLPYWYPDFVEGSPVFFYFPLYFAMMTGLCSLLFIRNRAAMDDDTVAWLQWLSRSGRFNPILIGVLVLVGIYMKSHFLLFPVAVTLWILRSALAASLQE